MKKSTLTAVCAAMLAIALSAGAQEKIYKIGDLYNVDGIKGVVFSTTDGGRHGKIVALKNYATWPWGDQYGADVSGETGYSDGTVIYETRSWHEDTSGKKTTNISHTEVERAVCGTEDAYDGVKNSNKLARNYTIGASGEKEWYCQPIGMYLKANAIVSYDAASDWYLPAIGELQEIYNACAQDDLEEALVRHGGEKIVVGQEDWYWSSTEDVFEENPVTNLPRRSWRASIYAMASGQQFDWHKTTVCCIRFIRRF